MADAAGLSFVQEVYATGEVVEQKAPDIGVVIKLGGEDAKSRREQGRCDVDYISGGS